MSSMRLYLNVDQPIGTALIHLDNHPADVFVINRETTRNQPIYYQFSTSVRITADFRKHQPDIERYGDSRGAGERLEDVPGISLPQPSAITRGLDAPTPGNIGMSIV